jgi:hypothetical protein
MQSIVFRGRAALRCRWVGLRWRRVGYSERRLGAVRGAVRWRSVLLSESWVIPRINVHHQIFLLHIINTFMCMH